MTTIEKVKEKVGEQDRGYLSIGDEIYFNVYKAWTGWCFQIGKGFYIQNHSHKDAAKEKMIERLAEIIDKRKS